jgi:hypothetical protein
LLHRLGGFWRTEINGYSSLRARVANMDAEYYSGLQQMSNFLYLFHKDLDFKDSFGMITVIL